MAIQEIVIMCVTGGFLVGLVVGMVCLHPMAGPWRPESKSVEPAPVAAPQIVYVQVPALEVARDTRPREQVINDLMRELNALDAQTERKEIR
jgi:hypothetical protein